MSPHLHCILSVGLTLGMAMASVAAATAPKTRTTGIAGFAPSITATCQTVLRSFSPVPTKHYPGIPDWSRDPVEMEKIRQTWQGVYQQDPRKHDPRKFVYLVTAHDSKWTDTEAILKYIREYPRRENIHLSAVSQDLAATFYRKAFGYIIRVPPENILATSPVDMTFQNLAHSSDSQPGKFSYGLHTPEALIGETNTTPVSSWNDVQARGTNNEKNTKIEVVGFFIVPNQEPDRNQTESAIRTLADITGLPIVTLPEPPPPIPMQ